MSSENALVARPETTDVMQIGFAVNTINALHELGADIAKSGIFGEINQSQGSVSLIAMKDEKLSVTAFRRKYQWVGNELSTRPNWMLGEFKRLGGKVHIVQADETACEIEFTHWDGETLTMRVTKEQMVANGVATKSDGKTLKDNWRKFADDMLFARVCGKGLRRLAPEIFAGCYTDGEAQDFEPSLPSAPKEIAPEAVKTRISKISKTKQKEETAPQAEVVEAAAEEPTPQAETEEPAAVIPEVMPSASDFTGDAAQMKCPVKGEWYDKTYAEIAAFNPDIITALLTCNRAKHPELTKEHLAALEKVAQMIQETEQMVRDGE